MVAWKFLANPVRFLFRLWSVFPTLVHFNPSFDRKSILRELLMLIICKIHNCRAILQFHGGNINDLVNHGLLPVYVRLIIKFASHIIVLTQIQKKSLARFCDAKKISVIPNMIEVELFPRSLPRHNAKITILYMSKIEAKKGIFDVIEAMAQVAKSHHHIELLVAGDGPDFTKLKQACCEHGGAEFIKFVGYLSGQQKAAFLSQGDIFLFPSHYQEGMPYALLEAMAAGLPVIATNAGGVPEIICHNRNGLLVSPGRPDQLEAAILQLIKHPKKRRAFGRMNRMLAATDFDIHIVTEKFCRVYDKLANHH